VGDVIIGIGFGIFGSHHWPLGPKSQFCFYFLYKLGENPHLLEFLTGNLAFVVQRLWPKNQFWQKSQDLVEGRLDWMKPCLHSVWQRNLFTLNMAFCDGKGTAAVLKAKPINNVEKKS